MSAEIRVKRRTAVYAVAPLAFYQAMKELAVESDKKGVEKGFSICSASRGVERTPTTTGGEYFIKTPTCEPLWKTVGTYHTHPHGGTGFSIGDIGHTVYHRHPIQCIGTIIREEDRHLQMRVPRFYMKCQHWDTEHPKYEEYRRKILEIAKRGAELELEMWRAFYEKRQLPTNMVKEYDEIQSKIHDILAEAEKEGVVTYPDYTKIINPPTPTITKEGELKETLIFEFPEETFDALKEAKDFRHLAKKK